ncbi:MAG: hypothetical protein IAE94_11095 [Chthoniobacterales bacterium]|nr:hypothetical protein [Chthoniobacterales bacterium]
MPRKKTTDPAAPVAGDAVASLKYPAKRKNISPAGLEAQGKLQDAPRIRLEYNPHLPPVLRSAGVPPASDAQRGLDARAPLDVDHLPDLLATARQRALSADEAKFLADALSGLKSLPFPRPERLGRGETWKVAVKVIAPRGNEGLRVLTVKD